MSCHTEGLLHTPPCSELNQSYVKQMNLSFRQHNKVCAVWVIDVCFFIFCLVFFFSGCIFYKNNLTMRRYHLGGGKKLPDSSGLLPWPIFADTLTNNMGWHSSSQPKSNPHTPEGKKRETKKERKEERWALVPTVGEANKLIWMPD